MCKIINLTFFILTVFVVGCSNTEEHKTKTQTDVESQTEKKNQLDRGNEKNLFGGLNVNDAYDFLKKHQDNQNVVLLDVRTQKEFDEGHISNCRLIDYYSSDFKEQIGELDKNKTYVVICRTGRRSGGTVKIMRDLGFKEAYNVEGGIVEWQAKNIPLDLSK